MILDVSNYDNARVARTILSELMKIGAYAGMKAYQSDMFIDYDVLSARPNVSGIYIIRDSGTQIHMTHDEDGSKDKNFRSNLDSTLRVFGTTGFTAYVFRDRPNRYGREIEITEFRLSDPHHKDVAVRLAEEPGNTTAIFWDKAFELAASI